MAYWYTGSAFFQIPQSYLDPVPKHDYIGRLITLTMSNRSHGVEYAVATISLIRPPHYSA